MGFGIITIGEEIGADRKHIAGAGKRHRLVAGFGDRVERIPDGPGLNLVAGESGRGIGGAEIDHLDIAELQPVLLQRRDQQIVGAGAFADADLPALQIGDRLDAAFGLGEDRLALAVRGKSRDINDGRTRRLPEDRRRIAGPADIDGADIQSLHQRRACGEFDPGNLHALGLERLFNDALLPGDNRQAGFLITDLQLFRRLRLQRQDGECGGNKKAGGKRTAGDGWHFISLSPAPLAGSRYGAMLGFSSKTIERR
ncbi:hypothetical protein D3C78_1210020 [compost metagenome]